MLLKILIPSFKQCFLSFKKDNIFSKITPLLKNYSGKSTSLALISIVYADRFFANSL